MATIDERETCRVCHHPEDQHDCCPLRCAGCGDAFTYHSFTTECPHDHVLKDDDGRDYWFYVCDDCDKAVALTEPDEDGQSHWEAIE